MSAPVTVRGRITRDPELSFSKDGNAIARFTVVSARRYKDSTSGEWTDKDTSFWDVSAFGPLAENTCETCVKGTPVIVTGTVFQEKWETKEGEKRTSWKVRADDVAVSCRYNKVTVHENGADTAPPRQDRKTQFTDEPPF